MVLAFFVAHLRSEGPKRNAAIYLRYKSPGQIEDPTANEPALKAFCYPLGPENVAPKEYMAPEEYTFTLTGGDGRRFQGFCRKFLPPPPRVGSKLRYPQVMCLIAEYPWCNFYFKVLQALEQAVKSGDALLETDHEQLPEGSLTWKFLTELRLQLVEEPMPGEIIRVSFPRALSVLGGSPSRMLGPGGLGDSSWSEELLDLQVPPDSSNGKSNCGIPLARLLWHVPIQAMLTLIASMLLERRIILVGQSRDTVTAAVQAASALIYPFKWHHIYLPLLPKSFKDYLTAPMPFMVGLPAQMLPTLKGLGVAMNEVTVVDLDLGKCDPAPGSEGDDAACLPWRSRLEEALKRAYSNLKSPTEYESSPLIAGIMQEYFLKLFGNYRRFIKEDQPQLPKPFLGHGVSPRERGAADSRHKRNGSDGARSTASDDALKGAGHMFDHAAFVNSHKRYDKARQFLNSFRHSQMYEQFIQERLQMAANGYDTSDPFDDRLGRWQQRRRQRLANRLRTPSVPHSKWSNMLKKDKRTHSDDAMAAKVAAAMRRSTTEPAELGSSDKGLPFDPAVFFDDDRDDLDDLELEALVDGGGRMSSVSSRTSLAAEVPSTASIASSAMHRATHHPSEESLARSSNSSASQANSEGVHGLDYANGQSSRTGTSSPSHSTTEAHGKPPGHNGHGKTPDNTFSETIKHAFWEMKQAFHRKDQTLPHQQQHRQQQQQPQQQQQQQPQDKADAFGHLMHGIFSRLPAESLVPRNGGPVIFSNHPSAHQTYPPHLAYPQTGSYRKQLTGDGKQRQSLVHKYRPQITGDASMTLSNGRLKQPPPPQRPLMTPQQQLQQEQQQQPAISSFDGIATAPSMTSLAVPRTPPAAPARQAPATPPTPTSTPTFDAWDTFVSASSTTEVCDPGDPFAEILSSRVSKSPAAPSASPVAAGTDVFDGFAAFKTFQQQGQKAGPPSGDLVDLS